MCSGHQRAQRYGRDFFRVCDVVPDWSNTTTYIQLNDKCQLHGVAGYLQFLKTV